MICVLMDGNQGRQSIFLIGGGGGKSKEILKFSARAAKLKMVYV